jgi:hypothetical protein
MKKIVLSLLVLFLLFTSNSFSQAINFQATVNRTEVSLDDQINLTISVSGNISSVPKPTLPALADFNIISSGRSQNLNFINGQVSTAVSFTYVLIPKTIGKFTIGAAEIVIEGKTYKSQPIIITVTSGAKGTPQKPQTQGERTNLKPSSGTQDLFIETTVDKKKVFVNEQVTLTFYFYQGVRLFNNPEYTPPSLTGFWAEELPPQKQSYKIINGKQYWVTEIKTALFPTAAGKQTIGEARLKCTVEDLDKFFKKDPFSLLDRDLFSLFREGKPKILRSQPIAIEVLRLPELGKPENFKGAVGSFKINSALDKNEVEANQPATLKINIYGQGNIKSMPEPTLPEIKDFRVYNAASSEKVSKENYLVQGVKTYEITFVPKTSGRYTLPSLEFSYFDPNSKTYQTLKTGNLVLNVKPGKSEFVLQPTEISKQEIGTVAKDIRYIKSDFAGLKNQGDYLYKKVWFIFLELLPLLALVTAFRYKVHLQKLNSDIGYARLKRAHKSAKKQLISAKKYCHPDKCKEFHSEVAKAILQFLGDKLNLSPHGLTTEQIKFELSQKGFSLEKVDDIISLLQDCDLARFAPVLKSSEEMRQFLKRVEKAVVDLEK